MFSFLYLNDFEVKRLGLIHDRPVLTCRLLLVQSLYLLLGISSSGDAVIAIHCSSGS
jgi:hypothetical protein